MNLKSQILSRNGLSAADCDQVEFLGALQCAVSDHPH